jgi:hypothetical protein
VAGGRIVPWFTDSKENSKPDPRVIDSRLADADTPDRNARIIICKESLEESPPLPMVLLEDFIGDNWKNVTIWYGLVFRAVFPIQQIDRKPLQSMWLFENRLGPESLDARAPP